jgi:UDPglucose 6-dehydrogenase
MKIGVIGTGYVGLVTAVCFADSGNEVTGYDIDKGKIEMLKRGEVPIYEPYLKEMLARNLQLKRIFFTSNPEEALRDREIVFIAVGTPSKKDGSPDLKYLWSAVRDIKRFSRSGTIVVVKSTVPVGTSDMVQKKLGRNYKVLSNPEFLKEGNAVEDFMKPDRVIIGGDDEKAIEVLKTLHLPYVRTGNPIIVMDRRSAEMTKYASNAMLAMRVSFMNEIANICEKLGADVESVRKGVGSDKRIGSRYLFPGTGYGGSCFPKDLQGLISMAESKGYKPLLIKAVEEVNKRQKEILIKKASAHFKNLRGKRFCIWGLSFKPNTDDMREAPSITVINGLLKRGAVITAYDPVAMENAKKIFKNRISFGNDMYSAAEGADAIFLITEWQEFRLPDFKRLKKIMRSPVIFDGRNIYDPKEMKKEGFIYYGIGRLA